MTPGAPTTADATLGPPYICRSKPWAAQRLQVHPRSYPWPTRVGPWLLERASALRLHPCLHFVYALSMPCRRPRPRYCPAVAAFAHGRRCNGKGGQCANPRVPRAVPLGKIYGRWTELGFSPNASASVLARLPLHKEMGVCFFSYLNSPVVK